ncbi:MAG: glycosyltransferase [Candidatus Bilamarchaeaceae archaeon]
MFSIKVLNIFWGFFAGIAQFGTRLDKLNNESDFDIVNLLILSKNWRTDSNAINKLKNKRIIYLSSRLDFSWIWKLKHIIQNLKPNLILTHGFNGHIVATIEKFLFSHNIAMICTNHGLYHAPTRLHKIVEPFYNLFTLFHIKHNVLGVVCVSHSIKQYLVEHGVEPSKIHVIYNGIEDRPPSPPDIRLKIRREFRLNESDILIGSTSRLEPIKGLKYLIEAFATLSVNYSNIKLVFWGSGPCEHELRNLAKIKGLSARIFFAGFRSDIDSCLSAIDIFVLPSLAEYHSIGLLEAMRAAKAIVSTNVGGNCETVRHGIEALIVPPADVDALAKSIKILIDDYALRENLGRRARERFLSNFTLDVMSRNYSNYLRSIASISRQKFS